MGTWGVGILEDDVARDVYDRYLQAQGTGQGADAIVQSLCDEFANVVSDPDEGPVFWLAVAQAQWECSSVSPQVRKRVEEIIEAGFGLARWSEAGADQLAQRKAALSRFATKIRKPRKQIARPPAATHAVPFVVGDCLAIEVADGQFGAAVVTNYLSGTSPSHILSIVDFCAATPPAAEMFSPPSWRKVTESPTLTIVKYAVYSDGYRRHQRKYRIVCRIDIGEVPPPLTLTVANWGNTWRHLGTRLGVGAND